MRCFIESAVAALFILLVASSCKEQGNPPAAKPAKEVHVQLTCDVSGRIEPCGCFAGQFGGLTRLKTFLKANPVPSLRVDAGDAIAGSEDYQVIQYRHTLGAFADLGFHALNMGRREASLPAATLTSLSKDSPVSLISANVADATTGEPLLKPWVLVKENGVNYGIIGIVDPASMKDLSPGAGVQLLDAASVIGRYLPEVAKEADVIILLAFATEERMKQLAAQFFEIHLILGGDVPQPSQELVTANRSFILATTNQSRALARFEAKLENRKLTSPKHDITFMADNIPQAPELLAHAAAYRAEVRQTKLTVDNPDAQHADDVPGVRAIAQYVGTQACTGCHQEDHATWAKSGHAVAFRALQFRESEADPSCIGCHTVGFGTSSGYRREFGATKLVDVGCESCHGPGSTHIAQRVSGLEPTFRFRPLGAGDCVQCHHGEFSRPFDWSEFWPLIEHGKKAPKQGS